MEVFKAPITTKLDSGPMPRAERATRGKPVAIVPRKAQTNAIRLGLSRACLGAPEGLSTCCEREGKSMAASAGQRRGRRCVGENIPISAALDGLLCGRGSRARERKTKPRLF